MITYYVEIKGGYAFLGWAVAIIYDNKLCAHECMMLRCLLNKLVNFEERLSSQIEVTAVFHGDCLFYLPCRTQYTYVCGARTMRILDKLVQYLTLNNLDCFKNA